jgi:hypothetical protein
LLKNNGGELHPPPQEATVPGQWSSIFCNSLAL